MKRFGCIVGLLALVACTGSGGISAHSGNSLTDPDPPVVGDDKEKGADDAGAAAPDAAPPSDASTPLEGDGGAAEPTLPDPTYWENGTTCGTKPDVQVWKYTPSTTIFRQSVCANFEAPFNYLFFGKTRALLLDTGTGEANIRGAVDTAIAEYVAANGITGSYPLVVAHTHSHGDHVLGDGQLKTRPETTIIGYSAAAVATAFGFAAAPGGVAQFDLGDRVIDVMPLPGHEQAHIALYDRQEHLLFTGDTLYPGRLYVDKWPAFQASIHRLAEWVKTNNIPVKHVLGNHIEMNKTPGQDYPFGAATHPDEHVIQLSIADLNELDVATQAMGATPRRERHKNFIIFP